MKAAQEEFPWMTLSRFAYGCLITAGSEEVKDFSKENFRDGGIFP